MIEHPKIQWYSIFSSGFVEKDLITTRIKDKEEMYYVNYDY